VTKDGLHDQLLNKVVQHERADLEEKRTALIKEMSENQTEIKEIEDMILKELANNKGPILEN